MNLKKQNFKYKSIFKFKKKKKIQKKIKISLGIYRTVNNFYLVCVQSSQFNSKVLNFVSGGMVNSLRRFNRTKAHTVELCARKISYFLLNLKNKKQFSLQLVLYSYCSKRFLKSIVKGLRYHQISFEQIFDKRRLVHNGCLLPKVRRI